MKTKHLKSHPILNISLQDREKINFYYNGKNLTAYKNDILASALIANGINIFGHHIKDKSPQGIFCANGQCSQCLVIANGKLVKSCMTKVKENMIVESFDNLYTPKEDDIYKMPLQDIQEIETEVLIIGGGPAGLSSAITLAEQNINSIIVDDKHQLGGKLILQTHKFFGSQKDSYAGKRGFEIANLLIKQIKENPYIKTFLNSTVLYIFSDKKVGVLKEDKYILIKPKLVINAAGAREKFISFPGNTLPGIYGAGAFQTLVNRDGVKCCNNLFIIGAGNVGLIAAYHALQANIKVLGIAEALNKVSGYKVHADKIKRLGVNIYTGHTILSAEGKERLQKITIAKIDENFNIIEGTYKTFNVDTLLIAVGLESINEFEKQAKQANIEVLSAGDSKEIAEASSAFFNGKIAGLNAAKLLGKNIGHIPDKWFEKEKILKRRPGKIFNIEYPELKINEVKPNFHCFEQIPCNPCTTVCPTNAIEIDEDGIFNIPKLTGKCIGCYMCVITCPGLAISLIDTRKDSQKAIVSLPYEFEDIFKEGDKIILTDIEGNEVEQTKVEKIIFKKSKNKTKIIQVKIDKQKANKVAGFRLPIQENITYDKEEKINYTPDDAIICRCERVKAGEIRYWIKKGIKDLNQIKALTRAGMGACGGKTCESLILRLYKEEGINLKEVKGYTKRPLFIETEMKIFADIK